MDDSVIDMFEEVLALVSCCGGVTQSDIDGVIRKLYGYREENRRLIALASEAEDKFIDP